MPLGRELPQLLKQRLFYKGRKFNFEVNRLRLPNKSEGEWECIRHPGGALAIPMTADGKLVLVRQYRFAVQGRLLEFPAGTVEPNESPLETVKREIEEETGYHARQWDKLGEFFLLLVILMKSSMLLSLEIYKSWKYHQQKMKMKISKRYYSLLKN